MGVRNIKLVDEDGVSEENLPNQFYRIADVGGFKVMALKKLILEFSGVLSVPLISYYGSQSLSTLVVVATDSMSSRRIVWKQFLKQRKSLYYIEARMGAELGMVYTIKSKSLADRKFYENTLYRDEQVVALPCTARTIIYNVLMISSLVCRAVKGIVNSEEFPREMVFNMASINEASFMARR